MESGWGLLVVVLAAIPLATWFVFSTYRDIRRTAKSATQSPAPVVSISPSTSPAVPQISSTNPAFAWNVVVVVVGAVIAVIGLINGLASDPVNSALRQTVGALWVIQGLLGLLIAAVGILGAGMVYAIERQLVRPPPGRVE